MPKKKRTRVPSKLSRRIHSEKTVAQNLLNGFVSNGSRGEKLIEDIIHKPIRNISLTALIRIASIVSSLINVKIERNYKRKKALIIKWFQENEDIIVPIKNCVKIVFEKDEEDNDQKNIGENDEMNIFNLDF